MEWSLDSGRGCGCLLGESLLTQIGTWRETPRRGGGVWSPHPPSASVGFWCDRAGWGRMRWSRGASEPGPYTVSDCLPGRAGHLQTPSAWQALPPVGPDSREKPGTFCWAWRQITLADE